MCTIISHPGGCPEAVDELSDAALAARVHRPRLAARFEVSTSDAPYLLLELSAEESVLELQATLRESNIAVRDARTFQGLDNHVRVTVRSPEENDALLDPLGV